MVQVINIHVITVHAFHIWQALHWFARFFVSFASINMFAPGSRGAKEFLIHRWFLPNVFVWIPDNWPFSVLQRLNSVSVVSP